MIVEQACSEGVQRRKRPTGSLQGGDPVFPCKSDSLPVPCWPPPSPYQRFPSSTFPAPGEGCPRATGPAPAPGPFPGLGLAPGLCGGWGARCSAAGSPPLDQSPGARQQSVPHRAEQGLLPGRRAGPPGGGAGPEDHGRHHWFPGLLQGLPGQEVSPGMLTPCSGPPALL